MAPHSSTLAWKNPWTEEPGRLQSMGSLRVGHDWATSLSLFTFHALEKEMATHSSVLAWRIPGTGEPGGLPSMGSPRVGHDWSDLAAALLLFISGCWKCFSGGYLLRQPLTITKCITINWTFSEDSSSRVKVYAVEVNNFLEIIWIKKIV